MNWLTTIKAHQLVDVCLAHPISLTDSDIWVLKRKDLVIFFCKISGHCHLSSGVIVSNPVDVNAQRE